MTIQTHDFPDVAGAIRNPGNPHHFMVPQPMTERVRVFVGKDLIADSCDALQILEIGSKAYPPRLYLPARDLRSELVQTSRTTHCPLMGHAAYFAHNGAEIGWTYVVYDFAKVLEGRIAFWSSKVRFEIGG